MFKSKLVYKLINQRVLVRDENELMVVRDLWAWKGVNICQARTEYKGRRVWAASWVQLPTRLSINGYSHLCAMISRAESADESLSLLLMVVGV